MKKALVALLIIHTATLSLKAQLNNAIDAGGAFAAVLSDGTLVTGDNDPSEYHLWRTNNHYRALGGTGFLTIQVNQDTTVDIAKSVNTSNGRWDAGVIHLPSTTFTSDLTINANDNDVLKNTADGGPGLIIGSANEVTINEGIFDGHQNQHWSSARAYGGSISSVSRLTLNGTSILGANSVVAWSHGEGSYGLQLTGVGVAVFNYIKDETRNVIQGGDSRKSSTWSNLDLIDAGVWRVDTPNAWFALGKRGGDGLIANGSGIIATNLYVNGGAAGGAYFNGDRVVNSTVEARASGGDGISGGSVFFIESGKITGGDGGILGFGTEVGERWGLLYTAIGGNAVVGGIGAGSASNVLFLAGHAGEIDLISDTTTGILNLTLTGGSALTGDSGGALVQDSTLIGGNGSARIPDFTADSATVNVNGGAGLNNVSSAVNLLRGFYEGGDGGKVTARISTNVAISVFSASGGTAAAGIINSTNGWFTGGNGGIIKIKGTATAAAVGGHGALVSGNSSINGGHFLGGHGGIAILDGGNATADGGHGAAYTGGGTLTIYDGEFRGGIGGVAWGGSTVVARGGHGVYVSGGTLDIRGGTFTGSAGGTAGGTDDPDSSRGMGLFAEDSSVMINGNGAVINGGMIFENDTAQNLDILAGTINGDITVRGSGTTTMQVSELANFSDLFTQSGGRVEVQLNASEDSRFFSGVNISSGTMSFENQSALLGGNASFVLTGGTNSILNFAQGAELSPGAMILAHMGQVTAGSNLVLRGNSSMDFDVDFLAGTSGMLTISGGNNLIMDSGSRVSFTGTAITPTGSVTVATLGSVTMDPNASLIGNFGWLNRITGVTTTTNIIFDYDYKSQAAALGDLDPALVAYMDGMITNMSSAQFYTLNKLGNPEQLRYNHTQVPDTGETFIEVGRKINEQIAARSSEFRSMNGFASTKHNPEGVAGPEEEVNTMKGWVRAYGAYADREKDGNSPAYDASSWGTVIGIDKNFGNLLIGLAGGYAMSDLEGSAYTADVTIQHGTLYSSFGGESVFIDLACTLGEAETEERITGLSKVSKFDSDILSIYAGGGKTFGISDWVNLTPQVSLLSTHYDQESFNRNEPLPVIVPAYDDWSYLGSFGFSLSSSHQVDLLRRGLAVYPEIHAHWLHEFNADPKDLVFISGENTSTRPREENLYRLGLGLDLWSWRYKAAKLELDFDYLMAENYEEFVAGGKLSLEF